MLQGYPFDVIDSYISKCDEKVKFHAKNSRNARVWNNILSLINLFLSSACALSMTIITVVEADSIATTVVGAVYAFLITLSTKIQSDFRFEVLQYAHSQVQDDYSELKCGFEKLKYSHEHIELEKFIIKYEHILKTGHLQTIKSCYFWCLCND